MPRSESKPIGFLIAEDVRRRVAAYSVAQIVELHAVLEKIREDSGR
jgi:hypothetical protein